MSVRPLLSQADLEAFHLGKSTGLFAFGTSATLEEILHPEFLSQVWRVFYPGVRVDFACGPEDARVYGTMVVTGIEPPQENRPAQLRTELLFSTLPPKPMLRIA